jgi:hypothetical protein
MSEILCVIVGQGGEKPALSKRLARRRVISERGEAGVIGD